MSKTRLEAFTDGVIAIILTIMVLELKIPHTTEWSEILKLYPLFISYLLSFLFICIYSFQYLPLFHVFKLLKFCLKKSKYNPSLLRRSCKRRRAKFQDKLTQNQKYIVKFIK